MIKIIITLVILFLVNNFLVRENFSNSYQDAILTQKLDIYGTNISKDKVLLTLYYDRREINCKYFYDYFSINKGGESFTVETFSNSASPSPSVTIVPLLPTTTPQSRRGPPLRFVKNIQFSGDNQAWNIIKNLYAEGTHHFIHPQFMNIEEIEVNQFDLNNFNNVPAHKIDDNGEVEFLRDKPREYEQFFRRNDFLKKIPFVTLTFLKHKDEDEILDIIKEKNPSGNPSEEYNLLTNMEKYNMITVNYEGIYSPNNREIQATVDNIKKFVEDSCDEYLKVESQSNHQDRIGGNSNPSIFENPNPHTLTESIPSSSPVINKCNECSEFKYI